MTRLTKEQDELLYDLYYDKGMMFGRDRLYKYLSEKHSDMKISRRDVMKWLKKQEIHQLYAPVRKTVDIRNTVLKRPKTQIGIDLIDMSKYEYDGMKWILTAFDLFSKKAYAVPLKDKTESTVTKAMKKLLKKKIKNVSSIRSDNGSEFISDKFKKMLKKRRVKQVLSKPGKPQSNGGIERFNKTLKRYLKMMMYSEDSRDWVELVPKMVKNYNKTVNTVTGIAPDDLDKEEDDEILKDAESKIKSSVESKNQKDKQKFDVDDRVRRKLDSDEIEEDGRLWSKTIYKVYKVLKPKKLETSSYAYLIKDKDEKYKTRYYNNDLLLIEDVQNEKNNEVRYEISKLIKPVFKDKQPAYVVRWKYFREKDDTIEYRDKLLEDVPKKVHKFEKDNQVTFYKKSVKWNG